MEMIQTLAGALGVEPKMVLLPMQAGDVEATYADIALAQSKLGFEPQTPIQEDSTFCEVVSRVSSLLTWEGGDEHECAVIGFEGAISAQYQAEIDIHAVAGFRAELFHHGPAGQKGPAKRRCGLLPEWSMQSAWRRGTDALLMR
jgi:hypothetical protein